MSNIQSAINLLNKKTESNIDAARNALVATKIAIKCRSQKSKQVAYEASTKAMLEASYVLNNVWYSQKDKSEAGRIRTEIQHITK